MILKNQPTIPSSTKTTVQKHTSYDHVALVALYYYYYVANAAKPHKRAVVTILAVDRIVIKF